MLKFLRNGDALTVYIFSISKIILTHVYSMREDIKIRSAFKFSIS